MDIGTKIRDRRLELGMTLEQVGDAVGVGKSTVRKWEQGMIKNMRRDKIALLATTLRMNPAELVDYDPQSFNSLTVDEQRLLAAYRAADDRAREDAMNTLLTHPREVKRGNLA